VCRRWGVSPPPSSRETPAPTSEESPDAQRFPDVVEVQVERSGEGYDFEVTISSPYDTPDRYADGWRVAGLDGTIYGEHTLAREAEMFTGTC